MYNLHTLCLDFVQTIKIHIKTSQLITEMHNPFFFYHHLDTFEVGRPKKKAPAVAPAPAVAMDHRFITVLKGTRNPRFIGKMVGAPWDGGPLIINPIYTLYSGYLLGISPFKIPQKWQRMIHPTLKVAIEWCWRSFHVYLIHYI